ncbi:unnamed protein product [Ectocarpus fasciculatus]
MKKGSSASRGTTVLGTPEMTSYGLFHQQEARANDGSGNGTSMPAAAAAAAAAVAVAITTEREPPSSTLSTSRRHHRRTTRDGQSNAAAPAFEAAAGDGESRSMAIEKHSSALLERHTRAAKDGVIDMLSEKASKLGVSLERALLAKREIEDGAHKLQVLLDEEKMARNNLEHLLQQKQAEAEASAQQNGHLKWEVDALRVELKDAEERSQGWLQEEAARRRSVEDALTREHAVAAEYLRGVYGEGHGPDIGKDGQATVAEVLVRELQTLGETLQERDRELGACAERLDEVVSDAKTERSRQVRETVQEQLSFTQERFEAAKHKARQLAGQLGNEAAANEDLRVRMHAVEEENDIRTRSLQERKAKAQQRKRGDARDMMAESKAKDDRIKRLESTLMQERARLEGELQSARSDYEEAAKESRRKAARLQRRCLELEYRVATQSDGSVSNGNDVGIPPPQASISSSSASTGGLRSRASAASGSPLAATAGLISVASMLPWRRDTVSSERSTSNLTTAEAAAPTKTGAGSAAAAQAAVIDGNNAGAAKRRGRGAVGDVDAASGGGTVVRSFSRSTAARPRRTATAVPPHMQEESSSSGGERKSFSSSSSTAAAAASAAAARLPDPSRHNEGAPAWMRSDLAVDRVRVD